MSTPESDYERHYKTPPSLIAFSLVVLVLCFMVFTIVFVCRYCFVSVIHTWVFQRTASGNRSSPTGLDPSLLQIFPTFLYADVKELHKDKFSLECSICLLEFDDDSVLRSLTVCCHVFHQECIDLWFRSHKTCPVCRKHLDPPSTNQLEASDDVHIDVREGEYCSGGGESGPRGVRYENESEYKHKHSGQQHEEQQRFARSHSTGHSIVLIRGEKDNDKYTLRLAEHVLTTHNCFRSCSSFREMTILPLE